MIGDILQPTHLLFVLVVALLVLGPKRLPEASRAIGQGIRDFRMAMSGEGQEHAGIATPTMPPAPTSVETSPAPAFDQDATAPEPAETDPTAAAPAAETMSDPTAPAQPVA